MEILRYIATALVAYLLGSIPTGYLVAKAKGIDIRSVGSGNIGATNVFRILGKGAGILVLFVDALKGFLACWLVPQFFFSATAQQAALMADRIDPLKTYEWFSIVAGVAAILGHNYTCWLKFKGGKGVATTAGVLIALFPKAFLIALAIWLIVFFLSKYVSLASIVAAISLPISAWWFQSSPRMLFVASFLAALAIYKHKANIQRLLNGTENRIGKKKSAEATK